MAGGGTRRARAAGKGSGARAPQRPAKPASTRASWSSAHDQSVAPSTAALAGAAAAGQGVLSANGLLSLQCLAGNQAVVQLIGAQRAAAQPPPRPAHDATSAVVQRALVAYPRSTKKKPVGLKQDATATAKSLKDLKADQPLKKLAEVPDTKTPSAKWADVETLFGGKAEKGFVAVSDLGAPLTIADDHIGYFKDTSKIRTTPNVPDSVNPMDWMKGTRRVSNTIAELAKGTVVETVSKVAEKGWIEVRLLDGTNRQGWTEQSNVTTPSAKIFEETILPTSKDRQIIGKEGANKAGSREESAKVLTAGAQERAQQLVDIFQTPLEPLVAFQRVAFILAGDNADVVSEFSKLTGRDLRVVIDRNFNEKPGKLAGPYLVSMIDNNGKPAPKYAIALPLGLVEGGGRHAGKLALVGGGLAFVSTGREAVGRKVHSELGKMGKDKRRVFELVKAMSKEDRDALLDDPEAMQLIEEKVDDKSRRELARWMRHQRGVETAQQSLEEAKKDPNLAAMVSPRTEALAIERDKLLAFLVRARIEFKRPGQGFNDKFRKGKKAGSLKTSFELAKFYDDLLDWKKVATADDIAQIKKPTSAFRHQWEKIPGTLMGVTDSEKAAILTFIEDPTATGRLLLVKSARRAIENQGSSANRGTGGRGLGTRISGAITESRWQSIEDEISNLDADQRKALLETYDPDPANPNPAAALQAFEAALRKAGLNKEERAGIVAMMNTTYGEAEDGYVELWKLVNPNTRTKIANTGSFLAPSKVKKIGKQVGDLAYKIVITLEDQQFAQVRQDKALLQAIQAGSDQKQMERILKVLGMKDINDQIDTTSTSSREVVDKARRDALHSPDHWIVQLDKVIAEDTIGSGVSAGAEKSALYVLITQIQAAAREVARDRVKEDPKLDAAQEAQAFLKLVLNGLEQKKVDYLKKLDTKKGQPFFAALDSNTPITVQSWLKQARKEGFGVGETHRVTDRQKIAWAIENASGRQLLDEWSNIEQFRELHRRMNFEWARANQAFEDIKNAKGTELRKAEDRRDSSMMEMVKLKGQMGTFVLGINEARRLDLREHVRNKEDRLQFEQMVTKQLIKAMKDDPDVQEALAEVSLPTDDFMKAKMKSVDALEMQRYLDSTRQWHAFSTASSQLDEATRNVKGSIVTTEVQQAKELEKENVDQEKVEKIRKEGAEQAEEALDQRTLLEARFRDTQGKFKAVADFLFTLLVQGIVIGLSAGMAAPLSIAVQIAITVGVEALRTAYKYFVLGETDAARLAVDFVMGVIGGTCTAMAGNFAVALQQSAFNVNALPDWFALGLAKGVAGAAKQVVMFAPDYIVGKAFQDKALEKVIKDGEDDILSAAGKEGVKIVKGFGQKLIMAVVKEGRVKQEELVTGQQSQRPPTVKKGFGEAYTDRLMGGSTESRIIDNEGNIVARGDAQVAEWKRVNGEPTPGTYYEDNKTVDGRSQEQQKMWSQLEKQAKKDTKKAALTAAKQMKSKDYEEKAQKDLTKKRIKELKGEEEKSKSPLVKTIKQLAERPDGKDLKKLVPDYRKRLDVLIGKRFMVEEGKWEVFSWEEFAKLSPDERETVEKALEMPPGYFDVLMRNHGLT